MTLTLITAAATLPVLLSEAREHVKASGDDDTLISALIDAATGYAETYTGTAFLPQTWEYVADGFPASDIEITLGPIVSVTSVKYLDIDGIEQTIAGAEYIVDSNSATGRVVPLTFWPTAKDVINSVRVRFVVGGTPSAQIKQAILMMVAHWYDNRASASEAGAKEVPMAIHMILDLHRRMYV